MGEVDLIQIIGNLGFPIAVAAYCLITLNKTVAGLKDVIASNTVMVQRMMDRLDGKDNG